MDYFFRHTPDPKTNISMAMVWGFLIIYLIFVYKFRNKEKLLKAQLIFVTLVEISLIIWYYQGQAMFLTEGLPLYHCRIAGFLIPIAYFAKKYKLANYFAYLGIIGPIVAYTIPDPSKYMWPHITNVTYICAHTMLIASGIMIVVIKRMDLDLNYIIKNTLIMNAIILIANKMIGANYGYMSSLPDSIGIKVPSILLLVAISFLLVVCINALDKLSYKLKKKKYI